MKNPIFEKALAFVLLHEGGYSNNPTDRGGETYCGISRRFYPDWLGWKEIDASGKVTEDMSQVLTSLVYEFYFAMWNRLNIDSLSEDMACFIFDTAVNCGELTAGSVFQDALNELGTSIQADGLIGNQTIEAFKCLAISDIVILHLMRLHRILLYWTIVQRKPEQRIFLYGWLNRTLTNI